MTFSTVTKHYLSVGLKATASFFLILAIAGCGGGAKDSASGSTGPGLTLSLVTSSGVAVTSAYIGTTYKLRAVATDSSGLASNVIVTFVSGGLGTLNPSAGTALTNSSGVAEVDFIPVTAGAAAATASASVTLITKVAGSSATTTSLVAVSGAVNHSIAASPPAVITFGTLSVGSVSLPSAGNTAIGLNVYSNGALATSSSIPIGFTVTCGQMSPNVVVTDGTGHVTSTYSSIKDDGTLCQGNVVVTATGANITTQTTITVAAPTTGTITFVSASPAQINLASSGSSTQSVLTFKVLSSGAPQNNLPVKLTLTGNPGGVSFFTLGNTSPITINSDSSGLVQVTVYAGGTPGSVTMKAEWVSNSSVYTTSNNFSIASSASQQRRFSLAVSTYNIEGWEYDGISTTLTAYVADVNGNAVPAGTVVQFTAESGQITSSCTTSIDANGHSFCTVQFISQAPRPADGRVSILAYLEGVKNYTDNSVPSNNQFDAGIDSVFDQGDAYRDDNENGQYDIGEFVITRGGSLVCSGSGGSLPSRADTCSGVSSIATTVRGQAIISYSSGIPLGTAISTSTVNYNNSAGAKFRFRLNGIGEGSNLLNNTLLPMPLETSVVVTTGATGCSVGQLDQASVPNVSLGFNPLINNGSLHDVLLTGAGCHGASLNIVTTTKLGTKRSISILVP
jgi:hypothetical protein